jgi:hypothetical protein
VLSMPIKLVEKFAAIHSAAIIKLVDDPSNTKTEKRKYFEDILRAIFPSRPSITLEEVILAKPELLELLLKETEKNIAFEGSFAKETPDPKKPRSKVDSQATKEFLKLYTILGAPLPYTLRGNSGTWKKHNFFKMLDFSTCPYCNRNIIQLVEHKGKSWQSGDLDHVIPKKKYPIFCVSFYNLIPVCKVCNFFKNQKVDILPNPYDSRYAMSKQFRFGIGNIQSGFPIKNGSFRISFKRDPSLKGTEDEKKINNLIKICKIEEQYKQHFDVAQEVVQKEFVFNESYREELLRRYGDSLFQNRAALDRALFGRYSSDEELHRRPLSKLIRDIQDHLNGDADWMEEIPEADLREVRKKVKKAKNNTSLI